MGSCVSLNKDSESAMKFRLGFRSKNDKVIIPSPVKERSLELSDGAVKSQWTTTPATVMAPGQSGSKEEAFFDSQPWLESDCEDDFFSVNGDFTPSRGSTPVHHSFAVGIPRGNRSPFTGIASKSKLEVSPSDKKKKLSELFKEPLEGDEDVVEQNAVVIQKASNAKTVTTSQVPPKSANSTTPNISGANSVCSNERSPNGGVLKQQPGQRSVNSAQCCFPVLRSSRSYNERKKRTSPAITLEA